MSFSDWLTSLVTIFDKTVYSPRVTSREVNITFHHAKQKKKCASFRWIRTLPEPHLNSAPHRSFVARYLVHTLLVRRV